MGILSTGSLREERAQGAGAGLFGSGFGALLVAATLAGCIGGPQPSAVPLTPPATARYASVEATSALVDAVTRVILDGTAEVAPQLLDPWLPESARGLVYVALRTAGERRTEAWSTAGSPTAALVSALAEAGRSLTAEERRDVDTVEVAVGGPDVDTIPVEGSVGENLDRGILGMRLDLADGEPLLVSPTRMIADNTSFDRVVERAREDGLEPRGATLFEATQLLIDLDAGRVHQLVRGANLVPVQAVTRQSVQDLADGMGEWLLAQIADDGRMVYEYFPSRGEESGSNNMIRQWMATIAAIRFASLSGDDDDPIVRRNVEYNLDRSFRIEGGNGLIADPDGDVKLGAVALAALAIMGHPDRADFAAEEAALRMTVDNLWNADGSFRTFYLPEGRNDNQNFYPGEALLLWAATLEEDLDPVLLDRFMRSFTYYRDWHRAQRNPAFVPWHTMAYERVWRLTGNDELRDFVFEMNDWLLGIQQWADAPAPDVAGRFYDPERPDYGPPHAASDGVYLEGLIAAYRLAVAVDDAARADAYRIAIVRGLRNLMQLQFADDVDMFYISQRDRAAGGLRTTSYDNRIRIDNVQHGLMAVLDVLEAFEAADYRVDQDG